MHQIGCSTKHLNKRGQVVNTLALCNIFKNLNMKDKLELMKTGRCCYTCTTPGHNSKSCKSINTCQAKSAEGKVCRSKSHHTLLHRDVTPGGTKQAAMGKSDSYSTDSAPTTVGDVSPSSVP